MVDGVSSIGRPGAEVIPGVRWGKPEWVPSAAFWAQMSALAHEDDDYVCRDMTLKEQVGFCLLGGFGITAEMNASAYDRLAAEQIFAPGSLADAEQIRELLTAPLEIQGRSRKYRFPNQKAARLSQALRMLEHAPPKTNDHRIFRRELTEIPGIGMKTASWITRNWLGSDDVAILDIHIIRAGILIGLFGRDQQVARDYELMEGRFLQFAKALQVRPSLLDAVMWRHMRALGRGPV
ncbi:hypothetical protein [Rhodopseudomonas sp. BR0G17]|uniref:8-oxoguanine DNA glycosylase n=1 Tax=Rhodopseudomonas sp. BR0G17 TaxID=2269368 RepID=UPI0013DEF78B|nr:hypothetical protein [Rhodopseudomonas sp. BR0G17]NEW97175.1 hypothetical protein [Rhodopseudomonas sp. BR0G17]